MGISQKTKEKIITEYFRTQEGRDKLAASMEAPTLMRWDYAYPNKSISGQIWKASRVLHNGAHRDTFEGEFPTYGKNSWDILDEVQSTFLNQALDFETKMLFNLLRGSCFGDTSSGWYGLGCLHEEVSLKALLLESGVRLNQLGPVTLAEPDSWNWNRYAGEVPIFKSSSPGNVVWAFESDTGFRNTKVKFEITSATIKWKAEIEMGIIDPMKIHRIEI